MQKFDKIVPDTSVLIEGILSNKINKKEFKIQEIIIHEAALAELEHQANQNKVIGFLGLDEIKRLSSLAQLKFSGQRPKAVEIKHASLGEIDALIRKLAYDEDATLITADRVQAKVAEARGMKVLHIQPSTTKKKIKLEKFFDELTMSVHLRQEVEAFAKKGMPGNWKFEKVSKKQLTQKQIQEIAEEIIEETKIRRDSFIEIDRPGSTIVQLGKFRIVITKPPFADGWEITAVHPVKRLELEDYKLTEKLKQRIAEQAEGILIAGAPGMGKSTFAQALAVHYALQNKIVKTVEAPRDLILPESITQYAISHGSSQEIHDILLLSRPDYTIFDEMRNTDDFKLFADMRLAGVGMVGVVHATNPIDAIQRFIGRVEMGVIPQIIDTVVFIKNGQVDKVLSLGMTVKVPSGMTEADLARPVVVVNDFETQKLEYEIYTYGEQTVVIPVTASESTGKITGAKRLAANEIERTFKNYSDQVEVDVVSDNKCIVRVPEKNIARIIGNQGKNIEALEKKLGLSIDVQELDQSTQPTGDTVPFEFNISKKQILLYLDIKMKNKDVDIFIDDDYLMSAKASKTALIKIRRSNKLGKILAEALNNRENVRIIL